MTPRQRRLVVLSGLVPAIAAATLSLSRPSLLARIEWRVYDTIVRAAGTRPPSGRVVIVDVDERSLNAVGQWPWRRDLLGQLIGNLRLLGAATVALDMVFPESDRYGEAGTDPDTALAGVLAEGGVVLGYAMTFDDPGGSPRECMHHPLGLAIVRHDDEHAELPYFRANAAVCNLPHLAQSVSASGFLNAAPDIDGILRRVPLVVELEGRLYPALALAAVSNATRTRTVALRVANVNASSLLVASDGEEGPSASGAGPFGSDMHVPLDGKSNLLVRYRGVKRTFPYVSAVDVLNGHADPATFKDKVVFVGTSALGTREVVSTPLDTVFTGVEVQATVADNLLQRDFLHKPESAVTLETLVVLFVGLLAALVASRFGLLSGVVCVAVSLVAVWTGAISLLARSGTLLSPLFPTIGLSFALAYMTGTHAAIERRRADRADKDKAMSQRVTVQALLALVEIKDAETARHSRRTQQYTKVLAQELATHPDFRDYLTHERIDLLSQLAPLHDIGKFGVRDGLLEKPGALTEDELLEMRKHPVMGRDALLKAMREAGARDDAMLNLAMDIVYTHHEKWDGTGYPQGLRGTDIPIAGRLIALVDVYDAAHSRRVYQKPMAHEEVVALIRSASGTHFDPAVVDAFVKVSPVMKQLGDIQDGYSHQ